jgi:hypothetical protein
MGGGVGRQTRNGAQELAVPWILRRLRRRSWHWTTWDHGEEINGQKNSPTDLLCWSLKCGRDFGEVSVGSL